MCQSYWKNTQSMKISTKLPQKQKKTESMKSLMGCFLLDIIQKNGYKRSAAHPLRLCFNKLSSSSVCNKNKRNPKLTIFPDEFHEICQLLWQKNRTARLMVDNFRNTLNIKHIKKVSSLWLSNFFLFVCFFFCVFWMCHIYGGPKMQLISCCKKHF